MRRFRWIIPGALLALVLGLSGSARAEGGHGAGEHDHVPSFEDVNWYYGVLGEKEGVPPDLLWRAPGTPVPFAAHAFNTLILFGLLYRFGKQPIQQALSNRKARILKGMEDAARLKRDAETRLKEYEEKLARVEEEVERVHKELRERGEHERARILADAKERRARMEREAKLLIEQELKAMREILLLETVRGAVRSAESDLKSKITAADQQRLADEYLATVRGAAARLGGKA
jgi:F-type H+-transporting ATPase subunit b